MQNGKFLRSKGTIISMLCAIATFVSGPPTWFCFYEPETPKLLKK